MIVDSTKTKKKKKKGKTSCVTTENDIKKKPSMFSPILKHIMQLIISMQVSLICPTDHQGNLNGKHTH